MLGNLHTVVLVLALALAYVLATPTLPPVRPLVVWHGLGDSYNSPAMNRVMDEIRNVHKDIFIHSVYIDPKTDADEKAGWFGDLHEQLAMVAVQLAAVPELANGFDAIGFSQGGQFLRAYVEWYNTPRVHNLITFGSQHFGVSDIPGCRPRDVFCQLAHNAAKAGIYTTWAQHNLIQCQYYRDERRLETYLRQNTFMTSINNELPELRNETFKRNFVSLNNLVLVLFSREQTVVPKESSWFGSYAPRESNEDPTIIPMRLQQLYIEDWIGLRELDESGKVKLLTCDGEHMQLSTECLTPIVKKYVGGYTTSPRERPALVLQSS
ncbi:alpha/beta-hydrolase [Exidia glandulosa HHB12029]|uniref:Palmitoyl-protein thioesterase 1 n=1 Tax=Exidia glandulosa HHB12029 TaxID=1314781 RepID=A0A165CI61_EXIGL|nr:alpha/beta-hydrolase [Exidia glandulosa HHB12029]